MNRVFSRIIFLIVLLSGIPLTTSAAFNANISGTIVYLNTYDNDIILFKLTTMPTTGCPMNDYFSISPVTVPSQESRNRFFTVLLLAKATGTPVNVGYDSGATCDNGRPHVYEIN